MKKLILPLVLITALLPRLVLAAPTTYTLIGAGGYSCAEWTAVRERLDQPTMVLNMAMMGNWVLGFISGSRWMGSGENKIEANTVDRWLDVYCKANPLENIAEGAAVMILEAGATR